MTDLPQLFKSFVDVTHTNPSTQNTTISMEPHPFGPDSHLT